MRPENKAFAIMLVAFATFVSVGGASVYALGPSSYSPITVVPRGSFPLKAEFQPMANYMALFVYSHNETAAYILTGAWVASAPVQVIVAEVLGPNYAGCDFMPINVPSGPPVRGCWPTFAGNRSGVLAESFHICVVPRFLPTGSFASENPAIVTVLRPFVVIQSTFPQSACPSP